MKATTTKLMFHGLVVTACWCGYLGALTDSCQAVSIGVDWNFVASDVHPTLEYFPTAAAAPNVFTDGPFQNLQGGIGTVTSFNDLPTILNAVGGNPSNLTFEFGNFTLPLVALPTPVMPLDTGSFVNGDVSGTAVQTYLPGALPNFDNTLIVKNAGVPVAQGRVTQVVVETVNLGTLPVPGFPGFFFLNLQSTGRADFVLDTAIGPDTIIFDSLFNKLGGPVEGVIELGVFGNAGLGDDPALFTSTGLWTIVPGADDADFDADNDVDGADFLTWQRGFESFGFQPSGDASRDDFIDALDLSIWEDQFGNVSSPLAVSITVPEPGTLLLVCTALGMCAAATRRRRNK